ncbi:MAG: hypothetical protein QM802_15980 [Agriterribacter sp.]
METLEIRHVRKLLILPVTSITIIIIASIAYIFLSEKFKNNNTVKLISIAGIVLPVYFLYNSWQLIIKNKPALVFHKQAIEINRRKGYVIFNWTEINYWKIEKIEDEGSFLFIENGEQKEKVSLNWLEKPPEEIETLMQLYIKSRAR